MSIKKLFTDPKKELSKVLPNTDIDTVGSEVESSYYVTSFLEDKERYVPSADFSDPSKFVKFGSAKQYYKDSISRIYTTFPYDGSLFEQQEWHNSSSFLDRYIFDNEYPRTTGYALFSPSGWSAQITNANGYGEPTTKEYILIKGGPNTNNVFDLAKNRDSNLKLDGVAGNSVEFWLKKDAFNTSNTQKEVIFDAWTTSSVSSSVSYGRFTVELSGTATANQSPFYVTLMSGTTGCFNISLGSTNITTSSVADSLWHHYAVTIANTGSTGLKLSLYVDGLHDQTIITGSTIGYVSGALVATIGSLITAPSGTATPTLGWGKLSGSLDEFRFWKSERSGKDIGLNWITQVRGGSNTDDANTDLGVYYKFNEGITLTSSIDSTVLDYSGRLSNGRWTGYSSVSRHTGSAIVSSGVENAEYEDPIVYSFHPDVAGYYTLKVGDGQVYDLTNNASMYHSLPAWITEEDQGNNNDTLLKLTQIMSSYLDTLYLQVQNLNNLKNITYTSGSNKPLPFANKLLESSGFIAPEIFADASVLEQFANRSEDKIFDSKLNDVKNNIYQNIYNNLSFILKSKGTEKSIRNLVHCFGIPEDLVKLNVYANNSQYTFEDNYQLTTVRKNYINFNDADRFTSTVYQYADPNNTDSVSYISGSTSGSLELGFANTLEAEVIFPKKFSVNDELYLDYPELSSSLFGIHTAITSSSTDTTWDTDDYTNFQVYAVRKIATNREFSDSIYTPNDVYFLLTSSNGGPIPLLTSSVFRDVYDNQKWNFAVRIKPDKYSLVGLNGTLDSPYTIEFYGANTLSDTVLQEFTASAALSYTNGLRYITRPKRIYIGSHRTNFTGSALTRCDAKISSVRYWLDYLSNDEIKEHAKDSSNFGVYDPYKNSYIYQPNITSTTSSYVPRIQTLALHWDFNNVSGSDGSGQFIVEDIKSGSLSLNNRYEWLDSVIKNQHTGRGDYFQASTTDLVDNEYIYSAKKNLPENVFSSDMVNIDGDQDIIYTRDIRPTKYLFSLEKSLYQTISDEMLKMVGSVKDFNNLIGEPVNRYRHEYKALNKLKGLFFDKVENTADLEKWTDYYRWLDSSLGEMIGQLVPATAEFISEGVQNVIESHVFERNKFRNKFTNLKYRMPTDLEGKILGINELKYNWKYGHAPVDLSEVSGCLWWKDRAERNQSPISSSNAGVNSDKVRLLETITTNVTFSAPNVAYSNSSGVTSYQGSTYIARHLSKPYSVNINESLTLKGGDNKHKNNKPDIFKSVTEFGYGTGANNKLLIGEINPQISCSDVYEPMKEIKSKLTAKGTLTRNNVSTTYIADQLAPFSIYSSSLNTGYQFVVSSSLSRSVAITNLHNDGYGPSYEIPMQGPFTEKYVGGHQHRHVDLNVSGARGLNSVVSRPEAYHIDFVTTNGKTSVVISGSDLPSNAQPRARFLREEAAKRPVNIRNIKMTSGSLSGTMNGGTVLGNYSQNYEIVQTSDRKINNSYFVQSEGLIASSTISPIISGTYNFTLPTRTVNKNIFVNVFSAPGGPEVMSRGYLDVESEQYSVYNALPWRNLSVRLPLAELYTNHTNQFGYFSDAQNSASYAVMGVTYPGTSGSVQANTYEGSASYHKVNRNTARRIKFSGSSATSFYTASVYDNWYIQHAIPQSDRQYAWVTASLISGGLGYVEWNPYVSSSYMFASASDNVVNNLKINFVGLNTLVYDSLSLASNIVSGAAYKNTSLGGTLDNADVLNALMLHRNGAYEWPTWKQIRNGESTVARKLRENNILCINQRPTEKTIHVDANNIITVFPKYEHKFIQYTEPPISSKYRPIIHGLLSTDTNGNQIPILVKHSYGNNISYFANAQINKELGLVQCNQNTYNQLYELYTQSTKESAVQQFVLLTYSEILYPREINAYLAKTRKRQVFVPEYWRDTQAQRLVTGALNSQAQTIYTASMWPLDARIVFTTGSASINRDDGAGELLNNYTIYHSTGTNPHNKILPGALYVHSQWERINNNDEIYVTDTKWEANEQAGRSPVYSNYDDYVEDIMRSGKGYTVVPEFRISEHMPKYVDNGGNFLADNDGFLTLSGSTLSSSLQTDFFKTYAHTDFLKYFDAVRSEHEELAEPDSLTLKCNAYLKLLPYNGFYPAQRTLQLVQLFSQSYGAHVKLEGTQPNFRTFLKPMFAPGVLFNTIKAGIACDYPIHTGSYTVTGSDHNSTRDYSLGDTNFVSYPRINTDFHYRVPFEALVEPENYLGATQIIYDTEPHPSASIDSSVRWGGQGSQLYKLAMHNYLAESIDFFLKDGELTSFISADDSNKNYFNAGQFDEYVMDVVMWRNTTITPSPGPRGSNGWLLNVNLTNKLWTTIEMYDNWAAFGPLVDQSYPYGVNPSRTGSSRDPFTPPYYNGLARARLSFRPFRAKTESQNYSVSDIITHLTASYHRICGTTRSTASINADSFISDYAYIADTNIVENGQYSGNRSVNFRHKMNLSSSINLFGALNNKLTETDPNTGKILKVKEDPNAGSRWVIQSKYETPILNFKNVSITLPLSGSGSVAKGMWHQYGTIPTNDGIYLQIKDPTDYAGFSDYKPGGTTINDGTPVNWLTQTGSLADLVGFKKSTQAIGRLPEEKLIYEAVIAIPYVEIGGIKEFFKINKQTILDAQHIIDNRPDLLLNKATPGDTIVNMVKSMQKYVFPPKMDFITNNSIDPFIMYIFEFSYALTKQDVADIYQNIMPNIGTKFVQNSATVSHKLAFNEFFNGVLPEKLRWLVFKVKQKAKTNYFEKTANTDDDSKFVFKLRSGSKATAPRYSYNWPYDYFSLVELAQIEAEVDIVNKNNITPNIPNDKDPFSEEVPKKENINITNANVSQKDLNTKSIMNATRNASLLDNKIDKPISPEVVQPTIGKNR